MTKRGQRLSGLPGAAHVHLNFVGAWGGLWAHISKIS